MRANPRRTTKKRNRMETTTPPNTSGFRKKPTCKLKRPSRGRKSHLPNMAQADYRAKHLLIGSFFLMCAAELLAPLFHQNTGAIPTAEK